MSVPGWFDEFTILSSWESDRSDDNVVAVAVPAWLGMADRRQLAMQLDSQGNRKVRLVSSALAAACGAATDGLWLGSAENAICFDVRTGWSAGLVRVGSEEPVELAAWGIGPNDPAGSVDDSSAAPWFVSNVLAAVGGRGDVDRALILVVDDLGPRAQLVEQALQAGDGRWASSTVVVETGERTVSPGLRVMCRPGSSQRSVGALAHALAVRADGDPDRLALHVTAPQHASFPSTTRQTFDLGPDDQASLHFDVYEEHQAPPGDGIVEHRLVLRAHLVRERGFDRTIAVTFDLLDDGLLSIGPIRAWRLDWQPGRLSLRDQM